MGGINIVGLNIFLQRAQQRGHQGLDGLAHLALVRAELGGDIRHRDLVEEVIETGHCEIPPLLKLLPTVPTVVPADRAAHPFTLTAR